MVVGWDVNVEEVEDLMTQAIVGHFMGERIGGPSLHS